MSKKIVELKSKRKVELKDMSIDEIDECTDLAVVKYQDGKISYVMGLNKSRTAWIRAGIKGGDFKPYEEDVNGNPADSVLKQMTEDELNELCKLIQEYQKLGE
jgi:hypothetical protein